MIGVPTAHVAGIPIEETVAVYAPALLVAAGAASASLRARVRAVRARRRGRVHRESRARLDSKAR